MLGPLGTPVRVARFLFGSFGSQPVETRPDLAVPVGEQQLVAWHFVVVGHALEQTESVQPLSVKRRAEHSDQLIASAAIGAREPESGHDQASREWDFIVEEVG